MRKFRLLRADEIDVRVGTCSEKGVSLLLYKDARVDMTILDETVGAMNWQKRYSRDNANCTVEIWDEEKSQWISKEDTGTESNTEKEKGLASDSFKRACVNWGIGRELYSAPFIWVPAEKCKIITGRNGKPACSDSFAVSGIQYDTENRITSLKIINSRTRSVCFTFGAAPSAAPTPDPVESTPARQNAAQKAIANAGTSKVSEKSLAHLRKVLTGRTDQYTIEYILNWAHVESLEEMTERQALSVLGVLDPQKKGDKTA